LIPVIALFTKLIICLVKQKDLRTLVAKINAMVEKTTNTPAIGHFRKLDDYINRCMRIYLRFGFCAVLSSCLKPLALLAYHYHFQKELDFSKAFAGL
jgi:hypothetical protein